MNKNIVGDGTRAKQPYDKGHKDPIDPRQIREATKTNQAAHTTEHWDKLEEKLNANQSDKDLPIEQPPKKENTKAA